MFASNPITANSVRLCEIEQLAEDFSADSLTARRRRLTAVISCWLRPRPGTTKISCFFSTFPFLMMISEARESRTHSRHSCDCKLNCLPSLQKRVVGSRRPSSAFRHPDKDGHTDTVSSAVTNLAAH
jgi:hypothetical protein